MEFKLQVSYRVQAGQRVRGDVLPEETKDVLSLLVNASQEPTLSFPTLSNYSLLALPQVRTMCSAEQVVPLSNSFIAAVLASGHFWVFCSPKTLTAALQRVGRPPGEAKEPGDEENGGAEREGGKKTKQTRHEIFQNAHKMATATRKRRKRARLSVRPLVR